MNGKPIYIKDFSKEIIDGFWLKVDKSNQRECWGWTGFLGDKGYGIIRIKGKDFKAHRLAYCFYNNCDILGGDVFACHTCDNRWCVNPHHIFLGSNADNIHDMENKGRSVHPGGEDNGMAKITEEDVFLIRELYADKKFTQQQLGEMFGLNDSVIGCITSGKNWKLVGGRITVWDNRRDAFAKLDKSKVKEIRIMLLNKNYSQHYIASLYGVNNRTISAINRNKIWKDVII